MLRSSWRTLAALAALCAISATSARAQHNPGGSIQTSGWNYLIALLNPDGCGGGGDAKMRLNWVTPYEIGLEDPQAGDEWPGIAFGAGAAAAGINQGGLTANPTWVTNKFLEDVFGLAAGTIPNGDVADFQAIVDSINLNIIPANPGTTNLPGDNVLSIATTYVRNETGAALEVDICSASDDSVQVWVNNKLVTNVSACRGTGNCAETRRAILPAGVSKIAVLVWEGGGGWGHRIGIRLPGAASNLIDGNGQVTFLGPIGAGQVQYCTERLAAIKPFNCPNDRVKVTVRGSGPGADGDALTVVEAVEAKLPGIITISDVTNGGVVTETTIMRPEGTNPAGFVEDLLFLGPILNAGGAGPSDAILTGVQIQSTTNAAIDESLASYQPKAGDTVPDNVLGIATTNCGACGTINPGGVLTWNVRTGIANFDFNPHYYGGDVNDCMAAVGFYVCVETARDVYFGVGSDDSFTIRVDGVVVGRRSIPRGYGAADEIQDLVGPVSLSAGKHFVLYKVYEGGGGHGGRIGLFNADRSPITTGISYSLDPTVPTCRSIVPDRVRKTVTWETTRGAVTNGELMYSVSYNAKGSASLSGKVVGVSITSGVSSIAYAPQSGPLGIFDTSHDIGNPPVQGSTTFDGTTYTQMSTGADFWDGGDDGHFAYKAVTGDFVATARITSAANVPVVAGSRWGRYGLMARWNCNRGSKYSMACQTGTDVKDWPRHQWRVIHENNGNTRDNYQFDGPSSALLSHPNAPWVRLVRAGTAIYSYLSDDDGAGRPRQWQLLGSDSSVSLPPTILVGMASHNHGSAGTNPMVVTFDNVSIVEGAPPEMVCEITGPLTGTDFNFPDNAPISALGGVVVSATGFAPAILGGRLRINEDGIGSQANAVWFPLPGTEILTRDGFDADYDVVMSKGAGGCDPAADPNPADGMTFAVVEVGGTGNPAGAFPPDLAIADLRGDGGGAEAYEGFTLRGRNEGHQSFAVEADNWVGGGEPGNEPGDGGSPGNDCAYHVGLNVNSSVSSIQTNIQLGVATAALPDVFAPGGAHFKVRYERSGHVKVWVNGVDRAGNPVPPVQVIDARIPQLSGPVLLGFTGGTGGATCRQEVDNVVISGLYCVEAYQIAGDCNQDGRRDISDILCYIYRRFPTFIIVGNVIPGPGCSALGDNAILDVNGSGATDVADIVYLANHLFLGGPGPVQGAGCFAMPDGGGCDSNVSCPD
jgi:hypothetical protein